MRGVAGRGAGTPNQAILAGFGAVLLWSSTPSVAGALSPTISFAAIAFYPILFAAIALMSSVLAKRRERWSVIRGLRAKAVGLLFVAGCALGTYELLFFYSLTHGPRAEAYVINYLWPIFFMLLVLAFDPRERSHVPRTDWLFVGLAVFGALLIGSKAYKNLQSTEMLASYLSAAVSAVGIGAYMALVRETGKHCGQLLGFCVTTVISLPVMLAGSRLFGFDLILPLNSRVLGLVIYEGLFVFAGGYLLWLYALESYPSITLASIIYLSPLVSVVWLRLFLQDPINSLSVYGAILIVLANYSLHSRYRSTSAATASMASALLVGLVCYLTDGHGRDFPPVMLIDLCGIAFAILMGFALSRIASKQQQERLALAAVGSQTSHLLSVASCLAMPNVRTGLQGIVREILRGVRECHLNRSWSQSEPCVGQLLKAGDDLASFLDGVSREGDPVAAELREGCGRLNEAIDRWLTLASERPQVGEVLVLFLLGFLTVTMFVGGRSNSLAGDLAAIVFGTGVVFMLFVVMDYDYRWCSGDRILHTSLRRVIAQADFAVDTFHDTKAAVLLDLTSSSLLVYESRGVERRTTGPWHKIGLNVAFATAMIWLVYLLAAKHSFKWP